MRLKVGVKYQLNLFVLSVYEAAMAIVSMSAMEPFELHAAAEILAKHISQAIDYTWHSL